MVTRLLNCLIREVQLRTNPIDYLKSLGMEIGVDCRLIAAHLSNFGTEPYLIRLGNHVTVSSRVSFITHDGGVWVFRDKYPDIDLFEPIIVGNNVFIGSQAIIMPGVQIGDNCIIGAGAVVTKSIVPNHVAVGVPARCIETIDEYWSKVESKAFHVRSLPSHEKQKILEEHFLNVLSDGVV